MEEIMAIDDPPVPLYEEGSAVPILSLDVPVVYEDEGYEDMGESVPHTGAIAILQAAITAHLARTPAYRVYTNLNLLYHPIRRKAYISPDIMVVEPYHPLPETIASYRIGREGPPPLLVLEVLSQRTAQQGDLSFKPDVLAFANIREYILVDPTVRYMTSPLLKRTLCDDNSWEDSIDADGGVTSTLGFRIIIDLDGKVRVVDAATGHRYLRPDEAEAEAVARQIAEEERQIAEERVRELEIEIARLKSLLPPEPPTH